MNLFFSRCFCNVWLCDPMDCSPPGFSVHGDPPNKNSGARCHALLQGVFPTQGSNAGHLHCRQILYHLSYQVSPRILEWVAYPFSRGPSWPRNWTGVSCIAGGFFTSWAPREAFCCYNNNKKWMHQHILVTKLKLCLWFKVTMPRWGRSLREENGNPLQYSCLENSMDRGAWWATIHGVARVRHDLVTKPP